MGGLDEDDVLDTLSSLVVHSLVFAQRQHVDEPRFTMLDSVRVYAHEQLCERGELEACLTRMTSYLRDFAASAGPNLRGPENGAWANRVDSELGDLRQTMTRAVEADDPETVVALTAPLFNYWCNRGLLGEMSELAEEAAGLPSASRLSPGVSALLGWARGMFRVSVGQTDEAQPRLREVLEAAGSLSDQRLRAYALAGLGLASANTDADEARKLLDEAVSAYRTLEDEWGLAFALSIRGQLALQDGDPATAEAMHREGLVAAEHIANDHLRAQLLDQLGLDAMAVGEVAGARDHFAAAADVHALVLDQEGSAYCLDGFAAVSLARGHPDVSARLLGASAHARELVGVAVWPAMRPLANAMLAAVSASLDDTAFAEATADGARMRLNDALAYALASTPAEPPSA